ncbi:MAG TPA: beta-ketoacyl-[acyl-carrier-protein] synthase family protein [Phycisphaerae bacterium]|nr:beta-ketoacyl-[acyl-carrier-protein] synthase family protein [Phycisphaerae bacterium]
MRRVVITGLGAISPHGIGTQPFWNALLEAKSSTGPLTRFDPGAFDSHVAGNVPAYKVTEFVPKSYRKATKIMARDIEMAVVAADFAVRDAKLLTKGVGEGPSGAELAAKGWFKPDPARVGCNIGAGLLCTDLDELTEAMADSRNPDGSMNLAHWGRSEDPTKPSGMEKLTPLWLLKYLPNMLSCHVSIIHDTQGPSNTITCGQSSAGLALMEATRTIQRNDADLAIVGGVESKVHAMALMRWSLIGRLNGSSNANPAAACRPYDKGAAGTVIAEGGGVLVIEEYEHAKKRGATIYAEIAGLASTASAELSPVSPDADGDAPAYAMKKALREAGVEPGQVQLVIPSGYGVPEWDKADVAALKRVFSPIPTLLPSRAGIGDCGAGAEGLDLIAGALALREQVIPPATNVENPIDGVQVSRHKTPGPVENVLVLSCAMGGQNSAVVLKRVH